MLPRILLIMMALLVFAPNPLPAAQKEKKMAYVVAPFAPVLRERRPESELLVQAHKGEKFRVNKVGEYWVEVFVPPNNEKGWIELGLETPKVEIITESDFTPFSRSVLAGLLVLTAVLITGFLVVRFILNSRHKKVMDILGQVPPRM